MTDDEAKRVWLVRFDRVPERSASGVEVVSAN